MLQMNKTDKIIAQANKEGRKILLEPEAKTICTEYCIPVTRFSVSQNENQALIMAEQIGYPVVLKIVSPEIIHKSDVGGVKVNIANSIELKTAYQTILANVQKYSPKANIVGVLVQEMAPISTEIIIGALKDPQFGQTVMIGLGGIFVEILKDVAFRIAPITAQDANEMIASLKAYPVFNGYRNLPKADIDAIVEVLLNVSKLVMDNPEIKELDLNPIMVYANGAKTLDARIILE
jgi:acyl-CoA synthetase (NDP forming)